MEKYDNHQTLLADLNNPGRSKLAIERLYHLYYQKIAYHAFLLVKCKADAEDLADEAFIKLWEKKRDFETIEDVQSFLYYAVYYKVKNNSRHKRVVKAFSAGFRSEFQDYEQAHLNTMIQSEFVAQVSEEIDLLQSDAQKMILRLFYYEDLSTRDIAERMDFSQQTVRNYKIKGLKLLEEALIRKGIMQSVLFYTLFHLV